MNSLSFEKTYAQKKIGLVLVLLFAAGGYLFMNTSKAHISNHFISEAEMETRLQAFTSQCAKLDASLTDEQRIEKFDRFFSAVKDALVSVGSFSEGGLDDADFSSSRYVDPARILTVISSVPITKESAKAALTACASMGSDYAIIFDGIEGRSLLFSNGDFFHEK